MSTTVFNAARPIEFAKVDPTEARVGTRLRLEGPGGEERSFTLLGPWDSLPEQGILSHESDLAGTLLGKSVGDTVQIEGKPFRVAEIARFR